MKQKKDDDDDDDDDVDRKSFCFKAARSLLRFYFSGVDNIEFRLYFVSSGFVHIHIATKEKDIFAHRISEFEINVSQYT
jgi:hypothetical protein